MNEEKITIQEISNLFHLPLHQACIKLGRSKEELNKICRAYGKQQFHFFNLLSGITRWPYSHRKKKTEKKEGNLFSNFVVDKPIALLQSVTKPQKTKEHFEKKKTLLPTLKEIKAKVEKEPDSEQLQNESGKLLEIQETRNKVMDVKHLCNF
jgi:hypothetical protein